MYKSMVMVNKKEVINFFSGDSWKTLQKKVYLDFSDK